LNSLDNIGLVICLVLLIHPLDVLIISTVIHPMVVIGSSMWAVLAMFAMTSTSTQSVSQLAHWCTDRAIRLSIHVTASSSAGTGMLSYPLTDLTGC
jgi:hypothetical protein